LTEEHRREFEKIGRLLDEGDIDTAAACFAELIRSRNTWLARRVLEWPSSPPITDFGSDGKVAPQPVPTPPATLPDALGVAQIRSELRESQERLRADRAAARADLELLLGLESSWAGQADKLNWVFTEVTKRHAKISGEGLGWWIRRDPERRSLARTVPLLPLASRDYFDLVVTGVGTSNGLSPFRVRLASSNPGFATMRSQLQASGGFECVDVVDGVDVLLVVDPELGADAMRTVVDQQVVRFRQIAESDAANDEPALPDILD
jgi:hypothetical protein